MQDFFSGLQGSLDLLTTSIQANGAEDKSGRYRAVHRLPPTVQIREDIAAELPRFRAIREKHGMAVPDDEEHLRALTAEGRVLLAITPDKPPSAWTCWGLD